MGPFLRFTHAFQTADNSAGFSLNKDAINVIQGGVSVSFDFPPRTYEHTRTVVKREVRIYLVPMEVQAPAVQPATTAFTLTERVYFARNSATLDWQSRDVLDAVAKKLAAHPNMTFTVDGHASADGDKNYNRALSARRATTVRDYLAAHGVAADHLVGLAHGVDVPAADNATQEGRERSRRVEFTIVISTQK
jgi:outer membrane protein OmpA-like peptidoglycan-associated protein